MCTEKPGMQGHRKMIPTLQQRKGLQDDHIQPVKAEKTPGSGLVEDEALLCPNGGTSVSSGNL